MDADAISDKLMKVQGSCPNCGTVLTFMESAQLAKQNGITEDAVMCYKCHKVYTVNLTFEEMSFVEELKKESSNRDFVRSNSQKNVNQEVFQQNFDKTQQNVTVSQQVGWNTHELSEKEKDELNSLFGIFFYKQDKRTGKIRISKTKTISVLAFILMFIFFLFAMLDEMQYMPLDSQIISVVVVFIFAAVFSIILFIIGYLISYILDKRIEKQNKQAYVQNSEYDMQYQNMDKTRQNLPGNANGNDRSVNHFLTSEKNIETGDEYLTGLDGENNVIKKSFNSVQEYVYNIAFLASDKKMDEAKQLCQEAKVNFPGNDVKFDDALVVGRNSQDVDFSYEVYCPKCNTKVTEYVGYCPSCGHQYIKGDSTSKWSFETSEEYVYRIRYLAQNNKSQEAVDLSGEACEHFPDDAEKFTQALLLGQMMHSQLSDEK